MNLFLSKLDWFSHRMYPEYVITETLLKSFRTKWTSYCRWSRVQIPQITSQTAWSYYSWKVNWSERWNKLSECEWDKSQNVSIQKLVWHDFFFFVRCIIFDYRWNQQLFVVFFVRCLQSNGTPHWPEVGRHRQVLCAKVTCLTHRKL